MVNKMNHKKILNEYLKGTEYYKRLLKFTKKDKHR